MFKYNWIILGLTVLVLMIGVILLIGSKYKENVILKQVLRQQEQMIKQKEERIQQLQEQLESLRKEQVLRERKVIELKRQKTQIKKPRTIEEIVREFKDLGYEVQIR